MATTEEGWVDLFVLVPLHAESHNTKPTSSFLFDLFTLVAFFS